jgi:hypothetical protein
VDAHGIAQVSPEATGFHLAWCGPPSWIYAPAGFTVQRRRAERLEARQCERLDAGAIAALRVAREQLLSFGVLTLRDGRWLQPLVPPAAPPAGPTPAEFFRIDLDRPRRLARISITAKLSFAVALCAGRVVAIGTLHEGGSALHVLRAARIDTLIAVALAPDLLQVCVDAGGVGADDDWADVPAIVKQLTLPLRELMPALGSDADELAEARQRLRPGEGIGDEEFARLAAAVRPGVRAAGRPRPSELALLLRENADDEDDDEARALDPLRLMLAHPTWRRALGFGWFDDDPALVPGETYEYRISAHYPAEDLADANAGFAAIPSGTLLPTDFSLRGLRFRVPKPVAVALAPGTPTDPLVRVTRRGIALDPRRESFWLTPALDGWSLVVDFPAPVDAVVLELAPGHDLVFAAGAPIGPFAATQPVPGGTRPRLVFATPVAQLRLRGTGFLHAVRPSTSGTDPRETAVVLPPLQLVDTPLPAPPLAAFATNLQSPVPAPTGPMPAAEVPARHALGFTVAWQPAPAFGATAWPADLEAAPPLDATIFQVERRIEPLGDWQPVLGDENWTLGDRDAAERDLQLGPGCDLSLAFPESASQPGGASLVLRLVDDIAADDPGAPQPGQFVRYRVRTIDAIGRTSPAWTETAPVRLEKHLPPPLPVGPEALPGPLAGVQVRVLVRDAPDLAPAEASLLGTDDHAIVLRWGWHAEQRQQDPLAREFRLYAGPPMDGVSGTVVSVATLATGRVTQYEVQLVLDRPVRADAAKGLRLEAGHPFYVRSHTAGTTVTMRVETRLRRLGAAPVPALGPVRLNLSLAADRSRPSAWGPRVAVLPIGDDTAYEFVLRGRLALSPDHPADALWLGISSADDQAYVDDALAPLDNRPGNESAIVPLLASGRYAGRPQLEVPPPLAAVPQLRTPEPGDRPLHFPLDLTAFLPSQALSGHRVRHERVSAGALLAACRATDDDRVIGLPVDPRAGEADGEIAIPHPADRAALVAALRSGRSPQVDDRFLVYLAGHHPYRDRLFVAAHEDARPPGVFAETLPAAPDRWVYRVRSVDAAGHVSAGAATAAVVVRVPSLQAGPIPARGPRRPTDPPHAVRVSVAPDGSVTHLLLFHAPSVGVGAVDSSEIHRVPNRTDLLPEGGLWLREPGGDLLSPTAHPLDDPAVVVGPDGTRELLVDVPGGPGARTRIWLATLTRDGIPSAVAGPYTVFLPA